MNYRGSALPPRQEDEAEGAYDVCTTTTYQPQTSRQRPDRLNVIDDSRALQTASPGSRQRHLVENHSFQTNPDGSQQYEGVRQVSTTLDDGEIHQRTVTERSRVRGRMVDSQGLALRLDLNLDVEVELKAKIQGDLTLALLYVPLSFLIFLSFHMLL
ncbi:hypothetical protein BJX61DRAFT_544027 [Aspergillus egyptiacus]|nr:hypothetical protein BJX61DRAFT_544027 [Aspergillus egyptiacus]